MCDNLTLKSKSSRELDALDDFSNFSVFISGNLMCRACLTQSDDMKPLFPEQECLSFNEQNDMLNMFISCTALEVSFDDPYPKHICNECSKKLNEAHKFRKLCRDSVQELNKINEKVNSTIDYLSDEYNILLDTNLPDISNFSLISDELEACFQEAPECDKRQSSFGDKSEYKHSIKFHSKFSHFDLNDQIGTKSDEALKNNIVNIDSCISDILDTGQSKYIEETNQLTMDKFALLSDEKNISNDLDFEDNTDQSSRLPRCHKCNISFPNRSKYKVHWNKYHSKYSEFILKMNDNPNSEDSKMKQKSPPKRTCHKCQLSFNNRAEYQRHYRIHSQRLCQQCGHISSSKSNFEEHLKTHSDLRQHECTICKKTYKTVNSLNGHKKTHISEQN